MSTLTPRGPYTDDELHTLYPANLQLQHVQVLMRHGERTPVNARFSNAGLAAYWPYCSAARHLRSTVLSGSNFSTLEWQRRLETFANDDSPVPAAGAKGEVDAICDMGQLTDRGRETTLLLGQRLRKLYVDQLGFLPAGIANTDFMYLRATPIPRALESMQQALAGLYPSHTRADNFPPPTIVMRPIAEETLFPNDGNCRRFARLARAFANRAAERWNDSPEMKYLNAKIGKWMPDDSPRIAVDSHPRLIGIMDTVNATKAHGPDTKLPKEFYDPKAVDIMSTISVEEWYAGYKESREYRALGIGSLLGDVVHRMVGSAEAPVGVAKPPQQTSVRFALSGCHDTTLAGALSSIGAFDNESWPPFTSHIAIELFRHADKTDKASSWWPFSSTPTAIGRKHTPELSDAQKDRLKGYYVRIRYNDKPVTVPGCKEQGKHLDGDDSFCTLVRRYCNRLRNFANARLGSVQGHCG